MRKVLYIFLGAVLLFGALSLGSYRHVYEPQVRQRNLAERAPSTATRSIQRDSAGRESVTASRGPSSSAPAPSAPTSNQTLSGWATFDNVINILNVVVGLIGIVLAIMGMRMQRQMMTSRR